MKAVDLIAAKRDGRELLPEEMQWLVGGIASGDVPDYQAAAWLMAAFLRGLSNRETADLTRAMVETGQRLDLSSVAPLVADKHSTGGVGDKTTLVVAPLVAAAGLPVGKMSGRGLGFSGGTIDKLESIPGFRTQLSPGEFMEALKTAGIVVAAQTPDLAPADGKLYALRDVTATVESIPLIAASIMSKKIAAGANLVVLDVKVGRGAFMKTLEEARLLAGTMRDIGRDFGLQVRAVISDMDQPLGHAVGNALEIAEAVETLRGRGPSDLMEVALTLGANLLQMAGVAQDEGTARGLLQSQISSGGGLNKLRELVLSQGGNAAFTDDPSALGSAPYVLEVESDRDGYLESIDAEAVGRASVDIGAGRKVKGEEIDHSVGFVIHRKRGDRIARGESLLAVHARSSADAEKVRPMLLEAFRLSAAPPQPSPVVLEVIP